jgi:hypothetical protein
MAAFGYLFNDVTVNLFYTEVSNIGNIGIGVNTDQTEGFYPADHSLLTEIQEKLFTADVPGAIKSDNLNDPHYTMHIKTTPEIDKVVQDYIDREKARPSHYNWMWNNCANFCEDTLTAGAIPVPHTMWPRKLYDALQGSK